MLSQTMKSSNLWQLIDDFKLIINNAQIIDTFFYELIECDNLQKIKVYQSIIAETSSDLIDQCYEFEEKLNQEDYYESNLKKMEMSNKLRL